MQLVVVELVGGRSRVASNGSQPAASGPSFTPLDLVVGRGPRPADEHVLAPLVLGLAAPAGAQDQQLAVPGRAACRRAACRRTAATAGTGPGWRTRVAKMFDGGGPGARPLGSSSRLVVLLVGAERRDPGRRSSGYREPDSRRGRDIRMAARISSR